MVEKFRSALLLLVVGLILVAVGSAQTANNPTSSANNLASAGAWAAEDRSPTLLERVLSGPELTASVKSQALPPLPRPRAHFDGLEDTLNRYRTAFEAMSLEQVNAVWPDLDQRRLKTLQGTFAFLQKSGMPPRLDLVCASPAGIADSVTVKCTETLTFRSLQKKTVRLGPVRVAVLLKKQDDAWVIESMKGK